MKVRKLKDTLFSPVYPNLVPLRAYLDRVDYNNNVMSIRFSLMYLLL